VSGTVSRHHHQVVLHLLDPVKIPAHNVPGFIEYEILGHDLVQVCFVGEYRRLDPLCITDAVGKLLFLCDDRIALQFNFIPLRLDLLLLLTDLPGPFLHLLLQFPVHLVLQLLILPELLNNPLLCFFPGYFITLHFLSKTSGENEKLENHPNGLCRIY